MQDDIEKGKQAERILEDAVFKAAVEEYSKQLTAEWSASEKRERREEIWMQQKALTAVVNNLLGFVQSGRYSMKTNTKEGLFK